MDAFDGGFSSMLEDGSGKIRIVERELVRFDKRDDIGPVLFGVVARGLADGMQFKRDHRHNTGGGQGFGVDFRAFQDLENLIIDEHEVEGRKGQLEIRFELMEIRGLCEKPVSEFGQFGFPPLGGRSGNQEIQIESCSRVPESGHRMSTDH